ncbi:MAG: threonine/serine ThrE exporter family protein [Nocardioidaceae bacterium]
MAGTALVLLHHVERGPPERATSPAVPPTTADDTAATAALLVVLGDAMIASGYTVSQVQTTLRRVLEVGGIPDGEVIVLPTAVFVSVPGQATTETALAAVGVSSLRLDQVEGVSRVVTAAETGEIAPRDARAALARVRSEAPPFGSVARTLGYALFSAGLALILSGGAADVIVAAGLGAVVGAIQLALVESGAATRAVLPLLCAFLVSTAVFILGRFSEDIGVLAPLVAPLVTFLPGALLTTAVVELSTGQMISGAGRLAAGLLQLVLLALGIVAGAELVGVTSIGSIEAGPLGDFGPWIGVALFGIGVLVYHCARTSSFGWILLVLYVAYGAQIIGSLFLGPLLSAFVGALVMSPVASYVALRPTGPPTQVSFLPAFWLLVPGALGLVGLTQLLGNNRADALASLLSMGTTMIGISFGVLIGLAIGTTISRHLAREVLARH